MKILTNHLRISSPQNILKEVSSKMSISLNNHESRIKALENKANHGSFSETTLFSGKSTSTITLNQDVNVFDAIVVMSEISHIAEGAGDCRFIPKSLYGINHTLEFAVKAGASSIRIAGNKISFVYNWGNTTSILRVVGLKIYYIFRYNIIPEFILRINYMIDKITHNFTSLCLKIQGGDLS